MATVTTQPQEASSQALQPTSDIKQVSSASLAQRIAVYRGKSYALLLYVLKQPDCVWADACRSVGVDQGYSYELRKQPGYSAVLEEIRSHAGDLRSEYARAAMAEAIPSLTDAMIARGLGEGRDAQRAGERILETVGVLPKQGETLQQAPIQVVTHTYVLVQPQPGRQGVTVETTAKELPPSK